LPLLSARAGIVIAEIKTKAANVTSMRFIVLPLS
jgi:hypothetical protein